MRKSSKTPLKPLTIGREAFAKISAVEGVHLSEEAEAMFVEFDRLKLSPAERRRRIIARFKRNSRA